MSNETGVEISSELELIITQHVIDGWIIVSTSNELQELTCTLFDRLLKGKMGGSQYILPNTKDLKIQVSKTAMVTVSVPQNPNQQQSAVQSGTRELRSCIRQYSTSNLLYNYGQ